MRDIVGLRLTMNVILVSTGQVICTELDGTNNGTKSKSKHSSRNKNTEYQKCSFFNEIMG